jgi:hypothetical protein
MQEERPKRCEYCLDTAPISLPDIPTAAHSCSSLETKSSKRSSLCSKKV